MEGQEYADAVYNKLSWSVWVPGLYDYNHAGLFYGVASDSTLRVLHAACCDPNDIVEEDDFFDQFLSQGPDYYGAYMLSTDYLDLEARRSITDTAAELNAGMLHYTPFNAIDYLGGYFDGTVSDIDNIRCDGVVEYTYEKNGLKVWWNTTESLSEWNISDWPDVDWHNNMPGITVNPDFEMSPWAQRGAPPGTGPSFGGPNPNNSNLSEPALVLLPFYSAWADYRAWVTYVAIQACDESGIHYIGYKIGSSGDWSYSPTQPQHPYAGCYMTTYIPLWKSSWVYFFAVDNGGNYPVYAETVWVEVGECGDEADCDDGDPCTEDECVDHWCQHTPIPGCCQYDEECDDGDVCTYDECLGYVCDNSSITPCCGNGDCEAGENHANCPADCPPECPNDVCDDGENPCNCPADCLIPGTTCCTRRRLRGRR